MDKKITLPRLVIIIAALVAIAGFFLPYISATEDYRVYMEDQADERPFERINITVQDMMDMSLFKYAQVYFQGGEMIFNSRDMGIFYGVLISLIAGFALLMILTAWHAKPILTLIFDLLMGAAFYIVNWDFLDRGIMPDSDRVWGIAHQLYYPLVAVIVVCAIWMLFAKRTAKKTA